MMRAVIVLLSLVTVARAACSDDLMCLHCNGGDTACETCWAGAGLDPENPGVCRACADILCTKCDTDYRACEACQGALVQGHCERCTARNCHLCGTVGADTCDVCGSGVKPASVDPLCQTPCDDPHCASCSANACNTCNPGFFLNGDTCEACSDGCALCNSGSTCIQCLDYAYSESSNCQELRCDIASCDQCATPDPGCQSCAYGFITSFSAPVQQCELCPPGMASCVQTTDGISAYSCPEGFDLVGNGDGVAHCGVCLQDHASSCPGSSPPTCDAGWTGASCDLPCGAHCLTCNSNADTCYYCESGYTHVSGPDCTADNTQYPSDVVPHCGIWDSQFRYESPNVYYVFMTGVCGSCDPGYRVRVVNDGVFWNKITVCEPCGGEHCTSCEHGVYPNGEPKNSSLCTYCETGYYLDLNTSLCMPCIEGCLSCPSASECYYCRSDLFLADGRCTACADPLCQRCNYDPTSKAQVCETCVEGYGLSVSGDGTCVKCELEHCGRCTDPGSAHEICVACQPNYFHDYSHTHCFLCKEHCAECADASECTACEDGFVLDSGHCVACTLAHCQACQDTTHCKTCDSESTLTGNGVCAVNPPQVSTAGDSTTTASASGVGALVSSTGTEDAGAGKLAGGPVAGIAIAAAVVAAILAAIITAFIMRRRTAGRRLAEAEEAATSTKKGSSKKGSVKSNKKVSSKQTSAKKVSTKGSAKKKAPVSSEEVSGEASASSVDLSRSSD